MCAGFHNDINVDFCSSVLAVGTSLILDIIDSIKPLTTGKVVPYGNFGNIKLYLLRNFVRGIAKSRTPAIGFKAGKLSPVQGSNIAHWLAYLFPDPAAPGLNHSSRGFFSEKDFLRCSRVNQQRTA